MKSMIEQMASMIMMMIIVMVFCVIISVSLQILNARLIHTGAIEQLQSSYYSVSIDDLNSQVDDSWSFELKQLSSINTRKDYELILHYVINIPLLKDGILHATISGYAR